MVCAIRAPFYTWEPEVQRATCPRSQDRCKFFFRLGTPDLEKQREVGSRGSEPGMESGFQC